MAEAEPFFDVADAGAIPPGEARAFEVQGRRVLICHAEGQLYAIEDVCTHDRAPLGEGQLRGCLIECERHGARFDVRTGAVKMLPAVRPVPVFPLRVADGRIQVQLTAPARPPHARPLYGPGAG